MSRMDASRWGKDGVVRPHGYHSTGSNYLRTAMLMAGLLALLVWVGGHFGGASGMLLFGSIGVAFNLGAWWFSDRIALAVHRARPVSREQLPGVYEIVDELARSANIPPPPVYLIPSPSPNAFATGRSPSHAAVAVTEGILQLLSPRELRGVLAHEISHVVNRDTFISTVAAIFAGLISAAGYALRWGLILGTGSASDDRDHSAVGDLAIALVAPLVAMLLQLAVSRSREYGADAAGARLSHDPEALASALERLDYGIQRRPDPFAGPATAHLFIMNPFSGRSLLSLLSTHPPTEQRIARLRAMRA